MPALPLAAERPHLSMETAQQRVLVKAAEHKPSSLKRKRPTMEVDLPEDSALSPKRNVTFSDQVEFSQPQTKPSTEIQREVRLALEGHARGNDVEYEQLAAMFMAGETDEDAPGAETLRQYTAALIANLSLLSRSSSHLVQAVLRSDWLLQDDSYVSLYIRLLGGLVSSYGVWVAPTLRMLVDKFAEGEKLACHAGVPGLPEQSLRLHHRLKSTLRNIGQLIMSTRLCGICCC